MVAPPKVDFNGRGAVKPGSRQALAVGDTWTCSCLNLAETFPTREQESEMTSSPPPYPADFREQTVEVAQAGRDPTQLSCEVGVGANAEGAHENPTSHVRK